MVNQNLEKKDENTCTYSRLVRPDSLDADDVHRTIADSNRVLSRAVGLDEKEVQEVKREGTATRPDISDSQVCPASGVIPFRSLDIGGGRGQPGE